MLSFMRVRIKIAFALMTALVVLLWVAANTRAIPNIRAAIAKVPPPPIPKPPAVIYHYDASGRLVSPLVSTGRLATTWNYDASGRLPAGVFPCPCPTSPNDDSGARLE